MLSPRTSASAGCHGGSLLLQRQQKVLNFLRAEGTRAQKETRVEENTCMEVQLLLKSVGMQVSNPACMGEGFLGEGAL